MADEEDFNLEELMNLEFNLDKDEGPEIISGGTEPMDVCKTEFVFDPPMIPEVQEPEVLVDQEQCLATYEEHVGHVMDDIKARIDEYVAFNASVDVPVLTFVYSMYMLVVYRYFRFKRTGNFGQFPFPTLNGNGILPKACRLLLDGFAAMQPKDKVGTNYTLFKFQADVEANNATISSRINIPFGFDISKITSILGNSGKYESERGVMKTILEAMNANTGDATLVIDFSRSANIGIFAAEKGLLTVSEEMVADLVQNVMDFIQKVNNISMFFTQPEAKEFVTKRLMEVQVCGKPIQTPDPLPEYPDTEDDPGYKDVDKSDDENMLGIKYWMKYASRLNIISLLPIYWAKGLILPTGLQLVPISWIPLLVIPGKTKLSVLFLTINGVVVFPVMWELRMNEMNVPGKNSIIGDNSYLKMGIRGANKQIKQNTGSQVLPSFYVNDIDVAPAVTKAAMVVVDDVPQFARLSLSNLPYLSYLNLWCKAAADILGLAP